MLVDTVRASEFCFKKIKIIKIFYSCLLIILLFSLSACLTENHLHQAIRYSEAAIMADDGKTISKHSEIAKIHALLVQNQKNISSADRIHMAVGIVSLDQAIEKGNMKLMIQQGKLQELPCFISRKLHNKHCI